MLRRLPLLSLVLLAACMGPFRRPDPDPRPAKVPSGVGILVRSAGGGCRSVLVGDRIRRDCRERGERAPKHEPKDSTRAGDNR